MDVYNWGSGTGIKWEKKKIGLKNLIIMQFVYMYKTLVTLVGPLLKPFSTIDSGKSNSAWAGFLCSQGTPPNQTACPG